MLRCVCVPVSAPYLSQSYKLTDSVPSLPPSRHKKKLEIQVNKVSTALPRLTNCYYWLTPTQPGPEVSPVMTDPGGVRFMVF